jgi:hypothetical protein
MQKNNEKIYEILSEIRAVQGQKKSIEVRCMQLQMLNLTAKLICQ